MNLQKLFLTATVLFSGVINMSLAEDGRKIHVILGDWKPFVSEDYEDHGKSVVKVNRIFKEANIPYSNEYSVKWPRVYNLVNGGYYDASYPWSKEEFRLKDFHFSKKPIGFARTYVVFNEKTVGKEGFGLKSYDDLMDYRISSVRTYYYTEILKERGADLELVNTEKEAFDLVANGTVDAMIAPADVYHDLVAKSKTDVSHVRLATVYTDKKPMHVIFSKRSENAAMVIDAFDKAYDHLLKIGELTED